MSVSAESAVTDWWAEPAEVAAPVWLDKMVLSEVAKVGHALTAASEQ